jgi:hypothetical protein
MSLHNLVIFFLHVENTVSDMRSMTTEWKVTEKKRILVIDDDEDILNWFRMLQKNDQSCSFFFLQDEQDIQKTIDELNPDLIFLEHHNAKKLSEIIRIANGRHTSVVRMSTRDLSHDESSFMRKPLERKAVELKIRELLKI